MAWFGPFVRGNPVGPQPVVHSRREVVADEAYQGTRVELIAQQMGKDYERKEESSEAFVYLG